MKRYTAQKMHVVVMKRTRRRVRYRMQENELIVSDPIKEIRPRKMSFMYYRQKEPKPKTIPAYGFEKKKASEVRDITERLSRPTYNRRLSADEPTHLYNFDKSRESSALRNRTPSSCGRRSALSSSDRQRSATRRLTDREMQRLIRRLQRPTESYVIATTEQMDEPQGRISRTPIAEEQIAKTVRRLRRPTTATMAKDINECHLCFEHENKKSTDPPDAFDYDYIMDKSLPPEELDYIVSRMRVQTCSSAHGRRCAKTPATAYFDEVKARENLPLLSGLARSKNVKDITNRLHPKPRYRLVPSATPITVY
ncbi:uncharacterized protein LOC117317256 isoform X1 [Pecten maximus]|uniref:uncharacterized protein LOC117317256 isoform X1 n=2 Tax=Pecten maximus TaxID=6579 RepID=UPI0014590121|nr:uncharacterized protein LOC117317256 isoform X1 [Pecten maximus]